MKFGMYSFEDSLLTWLPLDEEQEHQQKQDPYMSDLLRYPCTNVVLSCFMLSILVFHMCRLSDRFHITKFRSATSLQDLGMDGTEDSAQRAAAVERIKELQKGDAQRSRTPLKMLQTISKKVRDASASRKK